jgi:hypothetical protein
VFLGLGLLALLVVVGLVLVGLLIGLPVAVSSGSADGGTGYVVEVDAPDDAELRARWLAAEPREPSASGDGIAGTDRCDVELQDWLEGQFRSGMTPDQVEAAVGEPDSRRGTEGDGSWLWNLGVCAFIDYDTYQLTFEDGRLTDWGRVPG